MKCVGYLLKKSADPLYPTYLGQDSDNALFRAKTWSYPYYPSASLYGIVVMVPDALSTPSITVLIR